MKKWNVCVVGATGLVGSTILKVLEEREFPVNKLFPFSSKNSSGQTIAFAGKKWMVEELKEDSFTEEMEIAIFSAGGSVSEKFAPLAVEKGILVIDNSSFWRMKEDVPLIVPEVNPEDIKSQGIIANPNCSTIQCMLALKLLQNQYGLERVIYSSYQACSGAGVKGLRDLEYATTETFDEPIVKNLIPRIDSFLDNGYTKEEMKMIEESKKILHQKDLRITATTVRVPVDFGHAVSVNVELKEDFDLEEIRTMFANTPGLVFMDDPKNLVYPTPSDVKGKDEVYVGRLRRDFSQKKSLNMWLVADNVRKGAATNSVEIAELAIRK